MLVNLFSTKNIPFFLTHTKNISFLSLVDYHYSLMVLLVTFLVMVMMTRLFQEHDHVLLPSCISWQGQVFFDALIKHQVPEQKEFGLNV